MSFADKSEESNTAENLLNNSRIKRRNDPKKCKAEKIISVNDESKNYKYKHVEKDIIVRISQKGRKLFRKLVTSQIIKG